MFSFSIVFIISFSIFQGTKNIKNNTTHKGVVVKAYDFYVHVLVFNVLLNNAT